MDFIPCQLATSATCVPSGKDWLFEPKYDGYRCQLVVRSGTKKLFTRTGLDWTERLGGTWLHHAPPPDIDCVIDGEICVLDSDGRPDFGLLGKGLSDPATHFSFIAFDLLSYAGEAITGLPLVARKQRLPEAVSKLGLQHVYVAEHTHDGHALFQQMRELGWEGIMAKDAAAPYSPGIRSPAWRKIKCTRRQEFVVAGWRSDPARGTLKSVVLCTVEGGQRVLHGSVGSGFNSDERRRLANLFSRFSPSSPHTDRDVRWLEPRFVAEIQFQELSAKGCVRGASYLGLREDKSPMDVALERVDTELT